MRVRTLWCYLMGDRQAILEVASNPIAPIIGLLFVFSAGLAREYDGEDLWHEPWHAFIPLAASLIASLLLFIILLLMSRHAPRPAWSIARRYWSFLGLFWMTAPLAWLYAVPYERLCSPYRATQLNLLTLGLVAVWRVALMTRIFSVLTDRGFMNCLFPVMVLADALALFALRQAQLPVLALMGGVRLSEAESLLFSVTANMLILCMLSLPVWGIGALLVVCQQPTDAAQPLLASSPSKVSRPLMILSLCSVLMWAFVLPFTQPEQQLRYQVEQDVNEARLDAALERMSAHVPGDFPPHWDPPPRLNRQSSGLSIEMAAATVHPGVADWVRAVYVRKLDEQMGSHFFWYSLDDTESSRLAECLRVLPEGRALVDKYRESAEGALADYRNEEPKGSLRHQAFGKMIALSRPSATAGS